MKRICVLLAVLLLAAFAPTAWRCHDLRGR